MALFSSGKYSTLRVVAPQARKMVIPDGSWVKCRNCGQTLYTEKLEDNLNVCWNCGCHLSVTAPDRIKQLADEGSFEEMDMFVTHRCTNFGQEKKSFLGDGVVTGCGTICFLS